MSHPRHDPPPLGPGTTTKESFRTGRAERIGTPFRKGKYSFQENRHVGIYVTSIFIKTFSFIADPEGGLLFVFDTGPPRPPSGHSFLGQTFDAEGSSCLSTEL